MSLTTSLVGRPILIDDDCPSSGGSWQTLDRNGNTTIGEPEALAYVFQRLLTMSSPVMYDVGASSGVYCLLAAFIPSMRVFAFEPAAEAFRLLRSNLFLNGLQESVRAFNLAISDTDADATLKMPGNPGESGLATLGTPKRFGGAREVPCITNRLDSMELEAPNLIKIDTEGCELKVLLGAEQTIRRYRPEIIFEYNPINSSQFDYHPKEVLALLIDWGYKSFLKLDAENIYCRWEEYV